MNITNPVMRKGTAAVTGFALALTLFWSGGSVWAAPPSAPTITTPSQATTTNVIVLTGTAEPNASVSTSGGLGGATASTTATGDWAVTITLASNTTNVLSVVAINAGGEVSSASSVTIVHDNVVPAAPVVTSPANGSSTSTTPVVLSGTAEAGSEVFVSGGATPASGTTDSSGNWSALVNLTPNSANILSLTARDEAGNNSAATAFTITHSSGTSTPDTTAPAAPIVLFPSSPVSTTTSPIVVFGTAEAGSAITITGGAGTAHATTTGGGTWSAIVNLTASSTNTLSVTATDASGNTSSSTTLVVNMTGTSTPDTTAPAAPVITFPSNPYSTSAGAVLVTGTAEPGALVTVNNGSGPGTTTASTTGAWSFMIVLPTGTTTTYFFTATDASGNVSSSTSLTITQTTTGGGGGTGTTTATTSPTITLNGDANVNAFICNLEPSGFIDPGATAVTGSGATTTVTVTGFVNASTSGTYVLTYTATDGSFSTSTTRTVGIRNCSSGRGGGGGRSNAPFITVTPSTTNIVPPGPSTSFPVQFIANPGGFVPQTRVLGASYVPGMPSTGTGENAMQTFLAIMLSFGLVFMGLSQKREKQQLLS